MTAPRAPHRNLRLFDSAVLLAEEVHRVTRGFPSEERFGLTSQCRRAAVSIVANVAEGRARYGPRNLAAFLDIAYGSLRELEALLFLAHRLGLLADEDRASLEALTSKAAGLLIGLARWARSSATRND